MSVAAPPLVEGVEALAGDLVHGRVGPGVERALLRVDAGGLGVHTAVRGSFDASGRPLRVDAPFRIASVSKMITAATVLSLVDEGAWSLDDPLGRHLRDDLVERAGAASISLRRLLDHTSGLPDFFTHPSIAAALAGGGRRFRPRDLVALALERAPAAPVHGAGRAYSDTGFVLAGLAVEAVTGRPLHAASRQRVLDPAGMTRTWLESADDAPRTEAPSAHTRFGADVTGLDPTIDWAGGGFVSTADDLARLVPALPRLLSAASWRAMTTGAPGPRGDYDAYGLGLGRYVLEDGVDAIGHHGVWGAFTYALTALDAVVTGTVNASPVDRRPIVAAAARVIAPLRG